MSITPRTEDQVTDPARSVPDRLETSDAHCRCGHVWLAHSTGSSGCNATVDCPGGWTGCECRERADIDPRVIR